VVRILAVADIHASSLGLSTCKTFVEEHEPEIMVVAGDITNFGPTEWAEKFLDAFKLPLLAVNGNCDLEGVTSVIKSRDNNDLIDRRKELLGLEFLGLGYPSSLEFDTFTGENIDVLVSHAPPRGCNDLVPGQHIGDFYLRDFVREVKPRLVISGHVHESRGICGLEGTVCVNPGPAKDGLGAIVDINDEIAARLIEI
jgi:Icc-related predicted phosphoesterase